MLISTTRQFPRHFYYAFHGSAVVSGGVRWHWLDAKLTRSCDGGSIGHGLITDITEQKRVEEQLNEPARIDYLTQLPNRRYFREQMEIELYRMRKSGGGRCCFDD